MPTPEEQNQAAKEDANKKLDELNDKVNDLNGNNTDRSELPPGTTDAERIDKLKDELEEEIDKAQEAINANRIAEADRILRRLRRRVEKVVSNNAVEQDILSLITAVRKAKRRITAPPVALASFQPATSEQGVFISAEDAITFSASEVSDIDLVKLDLPSNRLKLIQQFGLRTVGDLVEWRKARRLNCPNS